MAEDTPPMVLMNVLNGIAANQSLLDESTGLSEKLNSIDFNPMEDDGNECIGKVKSIVDEIHKNITNHHTYFYNFYNNWMNRKDQCNIGNECANRLSDVEKESLKSSFIDDSFSIIDNIINSDDVSDKNKETVNLGLNSREETNGSELDRSNSELENIDRDNGNDIEEDRTDCNKSDITEDKEPSKEENAMEICEKTDKVLNGDCSQKNKDEETKDKKSEIEVLKTKSPEDIDNCSNKTTSNEDNSDVKDGEDISANCKERRVSIEKVQINRSSPTDSQEITKEIDKRSLNDISVGKKKSDDIDNSKNSDSEHIDNELPTENSDSNSNQINPDSKLEIKKEFKIKCVDINKLLSVASESPETKIPSKKAKKLNTSVVVISDSDNESPKKPRKKSEAFKENIPKLGKEITLTTIKLQKKTITLDESDSSNNGNLSHHEKKHPHLSRILRKGHKSGVRRSITDEREGNYRRRLRRRPVEDLTNVSSLSENSISKSSDSDEDLVLSRKKKSKTKSMKSSENTSLLNSMEDKKIICETYVPLTRIPAAKLKENYEKKLMKTEISKLTNMDSIKRSRRRDSKSSDSTGPSTSNCNAKKFRAAQRTENKSMYQVTSSEESDISMRSDPLHISGGDELVRKMEDTTGPDAKLQEAELAETLLNGINSDNSESKDSTDSGDSQSDKEDKKKKSEEKKKKKKSTDREEGKKSDKDTDDDAKKARKKWRKDKLLTENITESDSDEDFAKFVKKKEKINEKDRLTKKRGKYVLGSSSDGDSASSTKSKSDAPAKKASSSSESEKSESDGMEAKKSSRRRIKRIKDSSDENDADKSTRKNIRRVWTKDSLAESTIAAEKEEQERKARIAERQKKYNLIFEPDELEKATVDKVVLDFDDETERELLKVDKRLVKHLKPHQGKGIQFMWDTCFESLERAKSTKGSGCILAHCMGLGKTLQVIALIHTLVTNEQKTGVRKVLVVCPLSTVLNWVAEFKKWLPDEEDIEVFELVSFKQNAERMHQVKEWERCGGALILGYDMFRNLTNPSNKRLNKRMRDVFHTSLVDPGAQLVICDEGHLLKNEKTSISIAMNRLHTMRRIVLTGTPLQNNLKEYFCMVQFVKPSLLGTYKEYLNRFVNPITNGQYTDSTPHDIQIMRKRSHVLHKLLDGVVQRKDYSVLAPFLPPKHEYVLFVSLTELQIKLYEHYMREKSGRKNLNTSNRSFLFVDYNEFQRICTHPRVILDKSVQVKKSRDKMDFLDDESEGSLKDFIDDGDSDHSTSSTRSSESGSGSAGSHKSKTKAAAPSKKQRLTRATAAIYEVSDDEKTPAEPELDPSEWFRQYCTDEDLDNICHSGKLSLLFEILRQCELIGDKILIFSQSLYSLNVIEYFLNKIDEATQNSDTNSFSGFTGSWSLGLDYFRLDGSSSCDNRAAWCTSFNNPENIRARLFLISTKAGGLGINLVAANRVIIFDVSWNPSYDTQSIYRIYRFGQNKPCFIYRFVTMGAMEMKIYERQVTKQAISKRVIDEQQIDRHYNQHDLLELYTFQPKPEEERPIPLVPKDVLLGELLQVDKKIYKYHEHQSLLENKVDEVLDEEERKAAWEEFENEKKARQMSGMIAGYPVQSIYIVLQSLIQKENPTATADVIQAETAVQFKKMQEELEEGQSPIFMKAVAELRMIRAAQEMQHKEYVRLMEQQRAILNQYRQHQYLTQQQGQRNRFNSFGQMNPQQGMRMVVPNFSGQRAPNPAAMAAARAPIDYIDLND